MIDILKELNLTRVEFDKLKYRQNIECRCFNCKKLLKTIKRNIIKIIQRGAGNHIYCSRKCNPIWNNKSGHNINCKHCGKETYKPLKQIRKFENLFCSRKCASLFQWKDHTKIINKCSKCNKNIHIRNISGICQDCLFNINKEKLGNMTLQEFQNQNSVKNKHPSWINSNVRNLCRSWNFNLSNLPCQNCGYDKHVEFAYIKAISEFSLDTKINIINDSKNILMLCPNCHWEFDNKFLSLEQIKSRKVAQPEGFEPYALPDTHSFTRQA